MSGKPEDPAQSIAWDADKELPEGYTWGLTITAEADVVKAEPQE